MEEEKEILETKVSGKVYELATILVPTLTNEASLEKFNSIKEFLVSKDAEIISEDNPKLIELQYEMSRTIQNKKTWFDEGYFSWVKFSIESSLIKEIHEVLEKDESIIRFMIIKTVRESTIHSKKSFSFKRRDVSEGEVKEENKEAEEIVVEEVDKAVDALVGEI
jgi:ribosomal protein S6